MYYREIGLFISHTHTHTHTHTHIYIYIYISVTSNIYLITLVISESGRLSFASGVDATHKEQINIRHILH